MPDSQTIALGLEPLAGAEDRIVAGGCSTGGVLVQIWGQDTYLRDCERKKRSAKKKEKKEKKVRVFQP